MSEFNLPLVLNCLNRGQAGEPCESNKAEMIFQISNISQICKTLKKMIQAQSNSMLVKIRSGFLGPVRAIEVSHQD